jgi:hypothetical protein
MRYFILLLCLIFVTTPATYAAKIKTTEDLVQAMQKKYAKSWYRTATFIQKTIEICRARHGVSTGSGSDRVSGGNKLELTTSLTRSLQLRY